MRDGIMAYSNHEMDKNYTIKCMKESKLSFYYKCTLKFI